MLGVLDSLKVLSGVGMCRLQRVMYAHTAVFPFSRRLPSVAKAEAQQVWALGTC